MNFILYAYAAQDIGMRDNQEDCFFPPFIDPCHFDETERDWSYYDGIPHTDDRLFIVCDGMGGHDRGEVASQIVTKTMSESLLNSSSIEGSFTDDKLQSAVEDALNALYAEEDPNEARKMGTTMTVLKFHADGATVGHIGDSRVYQFRPAHDSIPDKILFHTSDHTVVNELVQHGRMTYQQAAKSSQRHVLSRSMSSDSSYHPEVEIDHIKDIKQGDIFLLCTDGIYENISDNELCSLMCDPNYNDIELTQRLLQICQDNKDNHTAYIIRVKQVMNASDEESSEEALAPGTVLKSQNYTYHIEKVLGQGAFGITYLVNTGISMQGQLGTIHTGVRVALKEFFMHNKMKRKGNELVESTEDNNVKEYAAKFQREASKMAMLSHPNIVKVLEVFEYNNTYYYSMEYLPDGSLNDYINSRGGLPEQEAIGCIRQIGSALRYLHANRMLHLDVKPANVMRDASYNTLKLIDFGLAKVYEENGDAVSSAYLGAGTSGYAPLEQSDSTVKHGFSPQLDVYALGATYYKLLTGQVPVNALDILNNGLPTMPLVKKKVSQQSIDAIKAAMQPTTAERLKTVNEFLNMLPRINDKTVFKPKKKIRFRHWMFTAILLILIILGAGIWAVHYDMERVYGVDSEESIIDSTFNMQMVKVEGGEFIMGCNDSDAEKDEAPLHKVALSTFYIGKYEVTQAQWRQVMENAKPSKNKNNECPIYDVTWENIQIFIERLNTSTGRHFRLPTEAEWEYAARGGKYASAFKYSGSNNPDSVAWYDRNSQGYVHPVGTLAPNALGIYDMSGNVGEFCSDFYDDYKDGYQYYPKGPKTGKYHIVRGGSWNSNLHSCRVTYRQDNSLQANEMEIGFRLVEDVKP